MPKSEEAVVINKTHEVSNRHRHHTWPSWWG